MGTSTQDTTLIQVRVGGNSRGPTCGSPARELRLA